MARKSSVFVLLTYSVAIFVFSSFASAQHAPAADPDSKMAPYVGLASELTSRARANVYFTNSQDIFRGVQFNFVNVGVGNLTFLRRDLVASGRIPLVLARVYDSSSLGGSDFGPGWRLSAAETISIQDHAARLFSESGAVLEFTEAGNGVFALTRDRPSDYSQLRMTAKDTIQAKLRTGFVKEFGLLGESYRLTKVTDRNGNEVHLIYKDGRISRIENSGHFIELTRNDLGRVTSAQDDQSRQVHYRYDAKGRLIETDDLGAATWRYTYTDDNKLKTALDPMKRINFESSYDDAGRVRRIKHPSGVIQYSYDPENRSTTVIDRKELVSRYFQNEEGITVRVVNPLGEETAIRLDAARNILSLSRNGTNVQSMEYDKQHRAVTRHGVTSTGPVDISYKYDPAIGSLSGIDSGSGLARAFSYDGNGNLSSAVTDGGLHHYGFSPAGDLMAYSDQESKFAFTPDADGLVASMKDVRDATGLEYTAGGELASVGFADGSKAKYEYQLSGLRAKLTYKDGRRVEYSYDSAGNLISTKIFDTKGKQAQGQKLFLNDAYQVVKRVLFDGTEETFEYDPNGNLTKHARNDSVTRFEYDELNRLVAVLTPAGERLAYTYKSGERSIVEQHEHSGVSVADLIDTGFTFASAWQVLATRPLTANFGTVRFSEALGTFQLGNASGAEVITPETTVEQSLQKLNLVAHGTPLKQRQNLFNRPFNTMFMPAEYATINCCFECSYGPECRAGFSGGGSDTTSCCPPCDPGPRGGSPAPNVSVTAAIVSDQIQVTLSGATGTDILDLSLEGPVLVVLANAQKGAGNYTFSFLRTQLPVGQYTGVTASWMGVSTTVNVSFDVLGNIRHSQYNTPNESACTGGQSKSYITDSSCSFNQTTLKNDFIGQTNLNGSGISLNFGIVNREAFCVNQPPAPSDAADRSFRQSGVVAVTCGSGFSANDSTVAVNPAQLGPGNTFQCGDQLLLVAPDNTIKPIKTVTDRCPACAGAFNGTLGHIDNYTTSPLCSSNAVGDYGSFVTIRLR